jgi:drug/metabolite transporter (DMT)-like permease
LAKMKTRIDKPNIISALLGFLGVAVSLVIGFYIISTMLDLAKIQDETSQIWIASVATTITAMVTACGSYLILKSYTKKGGKINIAGGSVLIVAYLYFSMVSQPKLLEWLNPLGIALVIPPILSGVISLMTNPKNQSESISANQ